MNMLPITTMKMNDSGTTSMKNGRQRSINVMGARHVDCQVTNMVVDPRHKIVSTPAYMLGKGPAEVFEGIRKLVAEVIRLC